MSLHQTATASSPDVASAAGAAHASPYTTASYLAGRRGFSFGHQLQAILAREPRSVLEVGVGSGITAAALRGAGIAVTTLDVDATLDPDILASVEHIPADDGTWDVASCCQVLEHLPFDRVPAALRELHRVTNAGLVLSLPDVTRQLDLTVRLPWLGVRRMTAATPLTRTRTMPVERLASMGHHWEIGFRGTPLTTVTSVIAIAGWRIERTWRVPELPWHRFFDLRHALGTNG